MEVKDFDSEYNAFMIQFITKIYNHDKLEYLTQMGVSVELAEMISDLPLKDAEKLARTRGCFGGQGFFKEDIVRLKLRNMKHQESRDRLLDKLIELGASHAMMHDLTGMESIEWRDRRKKLGMPQGASGRPSALNDTESTQVQNTWFRYRDEGDDLLRLIYVGCETGIPLSRIWQFLKTPDGDLSPIRHTNHLRIVAKPLKQAGIPA